MANAQSHFYQAGAKMGNFQPELQPNKELKADEMYVNPAS
jgi:hypothetical protein